MPIFSIETPSGKILDIEADNEQAAMTGAQQWHQDVDDIVRTTSAEEKNPEAQRGVASVIANRARLTGQAPGAVVRAPKQFEPWGNPATRARMEAMDPRSPEYQQTLQNIEPVLTNGPTTQATHFYAPGAQRALGRPAPKWDDGSGTDVGQTRFFERPQDLGGPNLPSAQPVAFTDTGESPNPAIAAAQAARFAKGELDFNAPAGSMQNPRGMRADSMEPTPGDYYYDTDGSLKQAPTLEPARPNWPVPQAVKTPSVWADMKSGAAAPFQKLRQDWGAYQSERESLSTPQSLGEAARKFAMVDELGIVGDVLNLASSPFSAIARPVARAINSTGLTPTVAPQLKFENGKPHLTAPRKLEGDEAQASLEGTLVSAMGLAMPKSGAPAIPKVRPLSLEELQVAKKAAYHAVDTAGIRFTPQAFDGAVANMKTSLQGAGLDKVLHPRAARTLKLFEKRLGQSPTLSELDNMRKVVARDVIGKDPAESHMGGLMRDHIDDLIENAAPTDLVSGNAGDAGALVGKARELNTRYRKVEAVEQARESAELQAGANNAGANVNNAMRQKLKPFVDPKSNQRIKNLTPEELKAMRKVVMGDGLQNLLRLVGKFSPSNPVMAMLHGAALGPTGGLSAGVGVAGLGAKVAADAMTASRLAKLRDLMSVGGASPRAVVAPYTPNPTKLLSAPGLIGATEVSQPLAHSLMDLSEPPIRR